MTAPRAPAGLILCALALLPTLLLYRTVVLGEGLYNADAFLAYLPAHVWQADGLRRGELRLWSPHLLTGFPLAFTEYGWFYPPHWLVFGLLPNARGYGVAMAVHLGLAAVATYALARRWRSSQPAAALAAGAFSLSATVAGGSALLNFATAFWALPALLLAVDVLTSRRHHADILPSSARSRLHAACSAYPAVPLTAIAISAVLLSSHPQMVLLLGVPVAAYAAVRLRRRWTNGRAGRSQAVRAAAALVAAAGVGVAVSAVRWLPTIFVVQESARSGGVGFEAAAGSVAPWSLLVGLLFPWLFVQPVFAAAGAGYLGPLPLALAAAGAVARRRHWRAIFLLGLLGASLLLALGSYTPVFSLLARVPPLSLFRDPSRFLLWAALALAVLAGFGLDALLHRQARYGPRWRRAWTLALAGTIAVALASMVLTAVLWLGQTRITEVARRVIDQRVVGAPGRALSRERYYATFDMYYAGVRNAINPLVPGFGLPLAGLFAGLAYLRWTISFRFPASSAPRFRAWAGPGIAIATLLLVNQDQLRTLPRRVFEAPSDAANLVKSQSLDLAAPPRVYAWRPHAGNYELTVGLAAQGLDPAPANYRLLQQLLAPNVGLRHGVAHLDGYENLMSYRQAVVAGALGSERAQPVRAQPGGNPHDVPGPQAQTHLAERVDVLAALGVTHVLSLEPIDVLPLHHRSPLSDREQVGAPAGTLYVFRVPWAIPRAHLVPQVLPERDAAGEEALLMPGRLWRAAAGPAWAHQVALIEHVPFDFRPPEAAPRLTSSGSEAAITRYASEEVLVTVKTDGAGLLVLADAHFPGWHATINDFPTVVYRANYLLRGVWLPGPGSYAVRFWYDPPGFRVGVWISVAGAGLILVWLLAGWGVSGVARSKAQREQARGSQSLPPAPHNPASPACWATPPLARTPLSPAAAAPRR